MKRNFNWIFPIFAVAVMGLTISCSYDDGELRDRIEQLEDEQEQMQEQIDAQQALLNALAKGLTITSIAESAEGYIITFSDGSTITIKHGDKGDKGDQGDKGDKGDKGDQGDSFIESIIVGEDSVTFLLADGTEIVIPLGEQDAVVPESHKIYYTTTDGKKIFPNTALPSAFGAILVSNRYDADGGVMIFDDVVTSLDAFDDCKNLSSIVIPSGVTSIAYETFSGCTSLESIVIPDGVTSMGNYAFEGCESLKSATVGAGIKAIGGSTFRNCTSLRSIELGANITSIGGYAFYGCSALVKVDIPQGVTSIESYAFRGCSALASISIPAALVEVGDYAFYECANLEAVHITDIAAWCGIAFENLSANPLYSARNLYFDGVLLQELTIPEGVKAISARAFYNCSSLTSVTIPQSLTSIGASALCNCNKLATLYCKAIAPPTGGASMFAGNATNRKIYVPSGSVESYCAATYWGDYADAIEGYEY